ncbi:MAG TPA: TlpA disulfide reductase family protein [Bryobacteraceae bacterium]|nr:TlpA disulfide reductase family protein [Bryobacteraceae bacterium]
MLPLFFLYAALVDNVRGLIAQQNFDAAEKQARAAEMRGATPDVAEAFSWIARGELEAKRFEKAEAAATETRKVSDTLLRRRKLDAEPVLPLALGASIEVHAQALAATGQRSEAVTYLAEQAKLFAKTSIVERIRKNLNLLSLEGKPAPELDTSDFLGAKPPTLASLRGKTVLLFFWAHWCSDCKAEGPIIAALQHAYAPRGLVVIAPTRYYGYVGSGEDAGPMMERPYIDRVRQQYYSMISPMLVPLSNSNFTAYGASTTPTVVLVDRNGIVRMYHPGAMQGADLLARIQSLLGR